MCWVLGEYGIIDGIYFVDDIIGKFCDVVEVYFGDIVVKVSVFLFYFVYFSSYFYVGGNFVEV